MARVGVRASVGVGVVSDIQIMTTTKCWTVVTITVDCIIVFPVQCQFLWSIAVRVVQSKQERFGAGIITI